MSIKLRIGIEIHITINTFSKLFSTSSNDRNSQDSVNIIDIALPGTLPQLTNKEAVIKAVILGMCFNCTINEKSFFVRKLYNYFDLPKGYQITQGNAICQNGVFLLSNQKEIRIKRIHLEEDAARIKNNEINYNRAGAPLLELVTEPDFSDSDEVIEFMKSVKSLSILHNISLCHMEEGFFRADINLSIYSTNHSNSNLYNKVEIKNMNSFHLIKEAIHYEYTRQSYLFQIGQGVPQQTLAFDEKIGKTLVMREKENAFDYGYIYEPDLPSINLSKEFLEECLSRKKERDFIVNQLKKEISLKDIEKIILDKRLIFFQELTFFLSAKIAFHWLYKHLNGLRVEEFLSAPLLLELIKKIEEKRITLSSAIELVNQIANNPSMIINQSLEELIDNSTLYSYKNEEIILICKKVLLDYPMVVADYKKGKNKAIGVLIHNVLLQTNQKADPITISQELEKLIKKIEDDY
jgi:aspartyl-tRNA(Asn)/glutamyl-tRNA(Gln) amidotransferase subunit B